MIFLIVSFRPKPLELEQVEPAWRENPEVRREKGLRAVQLARTQIGWSENIRVDPYSGFRSGGGPPNIMLMHPDNKIKSPDQLNLSRVRTGIKLFHTVTSPTRERENAIMLLYFTSSTKAASGHGNRQMYICYAHKIKPNHRTTWCIFSTSTSNYCNTLNHHLCNSQKIPHVLFPSRVIGYCSAGSSSDIL